MFGEPFSAEMKCPICNKLHAHLIVLDTIHFKEKIITFEATCANCQRVQMMMFNHNADPFLYKCSYEYWNSLEPKEDKADYYN